MRYVYLNTDSGTLHDSEEELIASVEETGELPQMEAITNMAGTETLIAAGHTPFTRDEALAVYRNLKMGGTNAGTRH